MLIPVIFKFLPVISSYTISPITFKSPPTVTIPANAAFPLTAIVAAVPTFNIAPSKVKLASSSSSPDDPAITTLLSVRSPINAVSADNESILAVPSMNRSWNSNVEDPKSLDPSASGNISPLIVAPAPTIRAPPVVTMPANAALPVVA